MATERAICMTSMYIHEGQRWEGETVAGGAWVRVDSAEPRTTAMLLEGERQDRTSLRYLCAGRHGRS